MNERIYEGLIGRYAPSWNMPATAGGPRSFAALAPVDATRQTHQRRFPHRRLDPAHKHHGAGAGAGDDALDAAPVGVIVSAIFIATLLTAPLPYATAIRRCGGQETGSAKPTHGRAGSDRACCARRGAGPRRLRRLMLPNPFGGR